MHERLAVDTVLHQWYSQKVNKPFREGIKMLQLILQNLPILICLVFGLGLLIVEVFMPGFGLPGIAGVILEAVSIVLTYANHGGLAALGVTLVILVVMAITISLALRSVQKGKLSKSGVILTNTESASEGYVAAQDMDVFLGKKGVATTVLRPSGMAEFDGVKLNVVADGEYIAKDTPVEVKRVEGARVVVRRTKER